MSAAPVRGRAPFALQALVVLAVTLVPFAVHAYLPYRFPADIDCTAGRYHGLALFAFAAYVSLRLIFRLTRVSVGHAWWTSNFLVALWVVGLGVAVFSMTPYFGAKMAKAYADERTLMAAISTYTVRFGQLPETLEALATARRSDAGGEPVLLALPKSPPGWSPYRYEKLPDGKFLISAAGPSGCDLVTVVNGVLAPNEPQRR